MVFIGTTRSSETYVYDANGQNTALVNRKAYNSLIDTYSYTYDAANNQTSKTDSKGTTTFEYDKLNRISTVTEPSGIKTVYTYDKAGNRTSEKQIVGDIIKQETLCKYNVSNYLLTSETKSQVLGTIDRVTYTYDVFNQLRTSDDGTHKISYAYNGIGYRVEKSVTTGPKESPVTNISRYLYEYDKVVLEVDGSGSEIAKNTYGTNLLSREMADSTVYDMYNGHGDVTALLNTAGEAVATYYYDIWGNIVEKMESELVSNPFRYAGYQYDEETGLYYLNARYYDAKIARFLTEETYRGRQNDPLSLNLYTYCHNEPIKYSDPTGHIAAALYEADGNVRTNVATGTAKNQSVSSTNTSNSQITNDSTKNKYEVMIN